MCGRFTLTQPHALEQAFGVTLERVPPPRYNIAPSQPVGVIVQPLDQARTFRLQQWGLIPSWAKDPKIGAKMINARSETAHTKPSFRAAFRRRRCLIPADGFYEWMTVAEGKQPIYFQLAKQQLFAFAGLWETWQDIETCTILTMAASEDIQAVHHRMPVILPPEKYSQWLDPTLTANGPVTQILESLQPPAISATPVSKKVNNARLDGPECIVAVS